MHNSLRWHLQLQQLSDDLDEPDSWRRNNSSTTNMCGTLAAEHVRRDVRTGRAPATDSLRRPTDCRPALAFPIVSGTGAYKQLTVPLSLLPIPSYLALNPYLARPIGASDDRIG